MIDPYVYPDTDILKNKFNIKDEKILNEMEAEYTSMRISEMEVTPINGDGDFDFKHLCETHRWIFQDIYDWAGTQRTINVEKPEPALGGRESIEYEKILNIEASVSAILKKMQETEWGKLSLDERASQFSIDVANLWKVHPFREGNTRTTIIFCCQFAEDKGFLLDRELFAKYSAYVRTALVAASAKFSDIGDFSQPEHLIKIVKDSMERGDKLKNEHKTMDEWKN